MVFLPHTNTVILLEQSLGYLWFYLEGNHMAARTFRKKNQRQSRVFFGIICCVYTNVDYRERVGASYWKQRRRIS